MYRLHMTGFPEGKKRRCSEVWAVADNATPQERCICLIMFMIKMNCLFEGKQSGLRRCERQTETSLSRITKQPTLNEDCSGIRCAASGCFMWYLLRGRQLLFILQGWMHDE